MLDIHDIVFLGYAADILFFYRHNGTQTIIPMDDGIPNVVYHAFICHVYLIFKAIIQTSFPPVKLLQGNILAKDPGHLFMNAHNIDEHGKGTLTLVQFGTFLGIFSQKPNISFVVS